MLFGLVFVINAFVVDWVFESAHVVASASAMIGALVLGYPIMMTAIKDLKLGRLSINELVAIAVLAAFASGDYKTAGVVAFFMLLGELIETHTAEGARNSIESLIKLTPTKARRIKADKSEEEVPASQLAVGDIIRIRPGDNVAADGVIVSGDSVNLCARVTSTASGGEIRLTKSAFQELSPANRLKCGNLHMEEMKGIGRPVEVMTLEWRDTSLYPANVMVLETREHRG